MEIFRGDAFQAQAARRTGCCWRYIFASRLRAMGAALAGMRASPSGWAANGPTPRVTAVPLSTPAARWTPWRKIAAWLWKTDNDRTNAIVSDLLPMLDHVIGRLSQTEARIVQMRMFADSGAAVADQLQKPPPRSPPHWKRAAYEEIMRFIHAINRIV